MTQPPEITLEARTDTQRTEDAIVTACRTIRHNWPHMIAAGETQAPGIVNRVGVILDDHDQRESDTRRIDRVISHRRYALDVLNAWCRVVMEDRPITNPKSLPLGSDVPGMARFIGTHAEWLSHHDAADDVRDELGKIARKIQAIVTPPERDWISLGSCPLEVEFDPAVGVQVCEGSVRAWPRAEDRDGEVMAQCRKCGTEAVTAWWEAAMFKDAELKVLLTAEEVVLFVHRAYGKVITRSVVRGWDKRREIESAGKDDAGRKLYHRDALVWALARRERSEAL